MKTISIAPFAASLVALGGAAAAQPLLPWPGPVSLPSEGSVRALTGETRVAGGGQVMIDQRSGLTLDTRLTGELGERLEAHDVASAGPRLQAELRANAAAYAPADRPDARPDPAAGFAAPERAGRARIHVYTRDGVDVGYVDRDRFDAEGRLRVRTAPGRRVGHVPVDDARFNRNAHAVVLTMSRSDFEALAAGGS